MIDPFAVGAGASTLGTVKPRRDEGRPARGEALIEILRALAALLTVAAWALALALVAG